MGNMRAILVQQQHDNVFARVESLPCPKPAHNEVLIEVHFSSLNYKDALAVSGSSSVIRNLPLIAGVDAAGIVLESRSENFQVGDEVIVTGYELSQTHNGGYAEYLCVPSSWVVPLPEGLTLKQSMALGTAGFTAALAVQRLLQNEQAVELGPIIVTGASGGVGSLAINILSDLGFTVTALTGKPAQSEAYLRLLGATEIMDRHGLHISAKPLERGLWGGAVDNLGGEILAWLTRTVQAYGNIASCGLAADVLLNTTVMPFILRGVSVLGIASSICAMPLRQTLWQLLATEWKPSKLDSIVTSSITFNEVVPTAANMLAGTLSGRYIVHVKQ